MTAKWRSSTVVGAFLVAAALAGGSVGAQPVDIASSPADYEPRLEQPAGGAFQLNNVDDLTSIDPALGADNIDTPTDAAFLRVGGQSRHKMNAAMFFLLPQSASVQTVRSAHLKLTQIGITGAPITNADLWAVGVYNSISVENDFDSPKVNPTIANGTDPNNGLAGQLYLEADAETNVAGLNTSVPRRKVADNFVTPAEALVGTDATPALRETTAAADASLGAYLNELYASTSIGPDTYLVLRLNPDGPVTTATNQYRFRSGNVAAVADRPTLTLDVVVPEPASVSLLGVAAVVLVGRRRRKV